MRGIVLGENFCACGDKKDGKIFFSEVSYFGGFFFRLIEVTRILNKFWKLRDLENGKKCLKTVKKPKIMIKKPRDCSKQACRSNKCFKRDLGAVKKQKHAQIGTYKVLKG